MHWGPLSRALPIASGGGGLPDLVATSCENARELVRICEILERLPNPHLEQLEDPDLRPYLWDLTGER